MLSSVLLMLSKAVPGTVLIVWSLRGKPSDLPRLLKLLLCVGFGLLYYYLDFEINPFFYIGPTLVLACAIWLLVVLLCSRPRAASWVVGVQTLLLLQLTQAFCVAVIDFFVEDVSSFVVSLNVVNLALEFLCCAALIPAVELMRRVIHSLPASFLRYSHSVLLLPTLGVYFCLTVWQIPNFEESYLEYAWMPLLVMGGMATFGMLTAVLPFFLISVFTERHEAECREIAAHHRYESMLARQRNDEEVRRLVHDLRNQIQCAIANVEEGRGVEHLHELEGRLEELRYVRFTSNSVIDTVLNHKQRDARERGIDIHNAPGMIPNNIMPPTDACSLISNALDNAIEACERIVDDSARYISVKFFTQAGYYTMVFTNSCPDAYAAERNACSQRTSKANVDEHGMGLFKIRRCPEKYNGYCNVSSSDGEFKLTVLMPIQ